MSTKTATSAFIKKADVEAGEKYFIAVYHNRNLSIPHFNSNVNSFLSTLFDMYIKHLYIIFKIVLSADFHRAQTL